MALLVSLGASMVNPVSSAFIQPADTPLAVTLFPARHVTQNSAVLAWSPSSDSDFNRYEVRMTEVSGHYGCSCTVIATIRYQNDTSITAEDMDENSTYYFIVRVYNDEGIYANSNEISVRTPLGPSDVTPPAITLISPRNVTYESQSVAIEWNASEPVVWAGYSLDGDQPATILENATLENLSVGTHTLTLYANDSSMNMGNASVSFTISLDLTPPTILHASPVHANEGSLITFFAIIMDDTVVTDAQVFYRVAGETAFAMLDMLKCPDCVDSYNATIIAPIGNDTLIEYYILASDGNNSATSPPEAPVVLHEITINAPPPPVQAVSPVNTTKDSVLLDWEPSTAADFGSYAIYVSQDSSQGALLAHISGRQSAFYLATGLSANTTYYFTVRVYDAGLLFQDSDRVAVTTLADNPVQPGTDAPSWLSQYGMYAAVGAVALVSVAIFVVVLMRRS